MKKTSSQKGWEAEQRAADYLEQKGYCILQRRFRCRGGELDLVAVRKGQKGQRDHLAFVEVKARANERRGRPGEAVDHRKRQCLCRAAACYLQENPGWQGTLSFDIIEVVGTDTMSIRHYENVFCPNYW